MSNRDSAETNRAEQLMKQHRFGEAIDELSRQLEACPDDHRALLELGICHLLNRSETEFLRIHERARRLIAEQAPPPEVSRVWTVYRSLAAKVTTAALALSTAGAMGCDRTASPADVVPETSPPATAEPADTTTSPAEATTSSEAAADPSAAATSSSEAAAATATPTPTPTQVRPAHRYSGGVRPPDSSFPAHRYSGGVLRN